MDNKIIEARKILSELIAAAKTVTDEMLELAEKLDQAIINLK